MSPPRWVLARVGLNRVAAWALLGAIGQHHSQCCEPWCLSGCQQPAERVQAERLILQTPNCPGCVSGCRSRVEHLAPSLPGIHVTSRHKPASISTPGRGARPASRAGAGSRRLGGLAPASQHRLGRAARRGRPLSLGLHVCPLQG